MSRTGLKGRRSAAGRTRRRSIGVAVLLAISVATAVTPPPASAVPPPPPNPSDADIAGAQARVGDGISRVSDLIDRVAAANQQLAALDAAVAVKREDVNKALVDLQNARSAADAAAAAVTLAQRALQDAGQIISDAQRKFDSAAVTDYIRGTGSAGASSLLDADGPQDVLDRAQLLRLLSAKQNAVLDGLQRARTEQANRDSAARASKVEADRAAAAADAKKAEAEQAIAAAVAAQQDQSARKAAVEANRDAAAAELESARAGAAGLEGQRDAYTRWDAQRQAEEAAAAEAARQAEQAAAAAAARVAADQAAADRAATAAAAAPDHTDLVGATRPGTGTSSGSGAGASSGAGTSGSGTSSGAGTSSGTGTSGTGTGTTTPSKPSVGKPAVTGSAAIELVIDRGMSVLGTPYSWGGGNENGPTKGIRDGGVADSYGDYNKVGFDCSGLMMYAFGGLGISLPHYTGYQYTAGKQVPSSQMKRGDMLFWGPGASQHVALYLGDGTMLEAPQSGDVVKVSPVRWSGMTPYAVRMVE
ncbi:NlpC/P60 family protein [Rhodococcoides corynebacterioides]|uniref:NlpC/P60 family protein n=1 Tax=Rhodococcoides corynebacterioides TaxID=53972 RepID=UPI003F7D7894